MKNLSSTIRFLALLFISLCSGLCNAQENNYELTEDSKVHADAPKGEVKGPFIWKSTIFPGTEREYWIYVPKQYDPARPVCTMTVQDGLSRAQSWNLPVVLDNLIYKKEIPVMIGIFVMHGKVAGADSAAYPRFNRSFEYDALGDRYARFLLEELLPEISKQYNLSKDPNDRSIAGSSSGGICAFNVAWERPNEFRRAFSSIGSFVGLRGGDEFPVLVRKTESKPIRVFLQDGDNDLNIYSGDWWVSNQAMLSALSYAGYEVNHAWGKGGHDSKQSAAIIPDVLRWLWKDYPQQVTTHKGLDKRIELLVEGKSWENVDTKGYYANQLAVNNSGEILFSDSIKGIYKVGSAGITMVTKGNGINSLACGAESKIYYSNKAKKQIVEVQSSGTSIVVVKDVQADYILTTRLGIYFSETAKGRIGFYSFGTKKTLFYKDIPAPTGLALSAEQTFLNVADWNGPLGYSYKVEKNGELTYPQHYAHYHVAYGKALPEVRGMTSDANNLLYAATDMGIQVADQLGKINFIFSKPGDGRYTSVAVAGTEIFIACGGKLYKRTIQAKGVLPFQNPVKPPQPRL